MKRWFERFKLCLDEAMAHVPRACTAAHHNKRRVKIQLAPGQLALVLRRARSSMLSDTSKKYDVPMHMHLLETAYQKEYAWRRGGRHRGRTYRPLRHAWARA